MLNEFAIFNLIALFVGYSINDKGFVKIIVRGKDFKFITFFEPVTQLNCKKLTVSANEDEAVAVNAITVKITLPDMELVEDAKGILESSFVSMWLPMMPTVLVLVVLIACAIMMVAV